MNRRSLLYRTLVVLVAAFALTSFTAPDSRAEYASETFKKGEMLFNKHCAKCHGEKASGTDRGPTFIHRIYHPNHHSDLSFKFAVERGVRAHHWHFGDMPKIEGVSQEEIDSIVNYVRTLQKEAGIF